MLKIDGLKIFFDLIKVFAVMNYLGRETDCYNNIIATKQDFEMLARCSKQSKNSR